VTRITQLKALDIRFPTSEQLDGSDAMNPAPDYSAAYGILETDTPGLTGHGLTFTIGRGNELCCAAIEALAPLIVGLDLDWIREDPARFWRRMTGDSQLRWVGPDKGVIHLAAAALVNAVWDLWAKAEGKPVWRLVADMSPEQIVGLIDFRYLSDCITPEEALDLLAQRSAGKSARISKLQDKGYPCYTTSAGWIGYTDKQLDELCRQAVADGFNHLKFKVGRSLDSDIRRLQIARDAIGPERTLMIDANQVWEVDQAIDYVRALSFAKPWFIEEPTSPDDIEGHRKIREAVAPVKVATGEMCQNRILFKQFIMRGAIDVVQLDNCRLGGLNEVLAVLLMAAKYGLPVCPHAGGVGLSEYIQHISMIDFLCFSGSMEGRVAEYVDHLHQHFITPPVVRDGRYMPPSQAGFSIQMTDSTISAFADPVGAGARARKGLVGGEATFVA
jgi:L-fuconate dehydratase